VASELSSQKFDDTFLPVFSEESYPLHENPASLPCDQKAIIRLAGFEPRSLVAGPGVRSVIWVAGCLRRCPGCSQPEYLPFNVGKNISVEELFERIHALSDIDGVTFSGGEPFEQAGPLGLLAKRLRNDGLSIVSYSGYRYEALVAEPDKFKVLLDEVDMLIDGEFRLDAIGSHRWRGSSNQRILCLTDRIKLPAEEVASEMQITLHGNDSGFSLSGIWPPGVIQELLRELGHRDFSMEREIMEYDEEQNPGGS